MKQIYWAMLPDLLCLYDCCGNIAGTKSVMPLCKVAGLLLTYHENQEILLGLCNSDMLPVFQIMLFYSFWVFVFIFSIPRNPKCFEMLGCSEYNYVLQGSQPLCIGLYTRIYIWVMYIYLYLCIYKGYIYTHVYLGCIEYNLYCLFVL